MSFSSDLMYRLLVKSVKDYAIYMVDREGTVLNWNEEARRAKGYSEDEVVGRNYDIFYSPDDRAAGIPQHNLETALNQGRVMLEGWRYRRDGSRFWASITIDAIYNDDANFLGFAKITRDLTEHHDLVSGLEYNATHDSLTGLLNRVGFFRRLEAEMAMQRDVTVFAVDLDHFKPINDKYGHAVGDAVLKAVAERLVDRLNMDFVGRLGGDEFVAVQCIESDPDAMIKIGLAVTKAIQMPIVFGQRRMTVGASVGVAYATGKHDNADMLLARADVALYKAKAGGRDAACLYSGEADIKPASDRYRQ